MNTEGRGFVILNQSEAEGGLLYNYMKIYNSASFFVVVATT